MPSGGRGNTPVGPAAGGGAGGAPRSGAPPVAVPAGEWIAAVVRRDGRIHPIAVLADAADRVGEVRYEGRDTDEAALALAEFCVLVTGWLRLGVPAVEIGRAFVTNRVEVGLGAALVAAVVACERRAQAAARTAARPGG